HTVGTWRVVPGVLLVGIQSSNYGGQTFPISARRDLAGRLNGGLIFWGHDLPRGRPVGVIAGARGVGHGVRGAPVVGTKHVMTAHVTRAALRRHGSLAMSLYAPVVKSVLADGRTVVERLGGDLRRAPGRERGAAAGRRLHARGHRPDGTEEPVRGAEGAG